MIYNVILALIGASFIGLAIPHIEAGLIFPPMLVVGGIFIGHALTEALNNPEN
jgi:hypothetical protein